MEIKLNSIVSMKVEQIKISGVLTIDGKVLPAGVNKTLDVGIISQIPSELIQPLTEFAFGEFTKEETLELEEGIENEIPSEDESNEV